ncbi:uncharacterized protein LOC124803438 [Schistocerca piceifrons]|uniref:uncharacterized protein LOC124803438 n=1 Tax=Schistocerca piceifrons TaxID=274613 RepID=UPI001F5FE4A0|nr:uncharacterized protein LOC124803438 [Schistocerca piceifrons]
MLKIHRDHTREYMEEKCNELLHEPFGQSDNFCKMSYTDFEYLVNEISPTISKKSTDFRAAIPAKYRLAITLRYLASRDSYKSLHYLFKVSTQAISKIIPEVCRALNNILKVEIKMPSTAEGDAAVNSHICSNSEFSVIPSEQVNSLGSTTHTCGDDDDDDDDDDD